MQKTLDGTQHLYIKRLHEQYGDIVRIGEILDLMLAGRGLTLGITGPNEVSLRDVSCVIPLLGSLGCPKGQSKTSSLFGEFNNVDKRWPMHSV